MIDHERSLTPEIREAITALINEMNVHLSMSQSDHNTAALAMSILDYFAAHVIVSVADMSKTMTLVDIVAMHSSHVREVAKRLDAVLKAKREQANGQQS